MKTSRQNKCKLLLSASFIIVFIAFFSCCSVPGVKGKVVDENNVGIAGVFIIYGYEGTAYKFLDSDTYSRTGTIVKTDKLGIFEIPRTIHFHTPFLKTALFLNMYVIYDPKTHCAGTLPYNKWDKIAGLSVFKKKNWWFTYNREHNLETLIFHDVTNNPIEWYESIRRLQVPIQLYGWNSWDAPNEDKRELLTHLFQEYDDFQRRYGKEECLFRQNFVKSQFPRSYEEFKEMKSHGTYEEYKEANGSPYKGKTWKEIISWEKLNLDDCIKRLFDTPDYWHNR